MLFWLGFVTGLIQNFNAASDEKQKCKIAAYKVLEARIMYKQTLKVFSQYLLTISQIHSTTNLNYTSSDKFCIR
jgi:hypothetical protein